MPNSNNTQPSLILNSLHNSPPRPLIKPVQDSHVVPTNFKIVNIRIFLDPTRRIALWQRYPSLLQAVSYQDLRHSFIVFLGKRGDGGIVCFLVTNDGGVGLDDDVVFVAVVDYRALLAPGVELGKLLV